MEILEYASLSTSMVKLNVSDFKSLFLVSLSLVENQTDLPQQLLLPLLLQKERQSVQV